LIADLYFATGAFNEFTQRLDVALWYVTPSSYISIRIESIHAALKHLVGNRFKDKAEVSISDDNGDEELEEASQQAVTH
ncbi:type VI secretion system protein TssA, partial [Vibrio parahaemolyticus]|nr:type VI secretion system protein TssA [Vibrio parahaemolyticus]